MQHDMFPVDQTYPDAEAAYEALRSLEARRGYEVMRESTTRSLGDEAIIINAMCERGSLYDGRRELRLAPRLPPPPDCCRFWGLVHRDPDRNFDFVVKIVRWHSHGTDEDKDLVCWDRFYSHETFGEERLERLVHAIDARGGHTPVDIAKELALHHEKLYVTATDVANILRRRVEWRAAATPWTSPRDFYDVLGGDPAVRLTAPRTGDSAALLQMTWTYSECVCYWKANPKVLAVERVGWVEPLGMTLFQISGMTGLQMPFTAAFALCKADDLETLSKMVSDIVQVAESEQVDLPETVVTALDGNLGTALAWEMPRARWQICRDSVRTSVQEDVRAMFASAGEPLQETSANPEGQGIDGDYEVEEVDSYARGDSGNKRRALGKKRQTEENTSGQGDADSLLQAWQTLVTQVQTEDEFDVQWQQLKTDWATQPEVLEMLETKYMPHRRALAHFAVRGFRDHEIKATTEDSPEVTALREVAGRRQCATMALLTGLRAMAHGREERALAQFAAETGPKESMFFQVPVVRNLASSVSSAAMLQLLRQCVPAERLVRERALRRQRGEPPAERGACPGTLRSRWWLPCRHVLAGLMERGEALALEDVDEHWRYEHIRPVVDRTAARLKVKSRNQEYEDMKECRRQRERDQQDLELREWSEAFFGARRG